MVKVSVTYRTVAYGTVTVDLDEAGVDDENAVRVALLATMPELTDDEAELVHVIDWTD